MNLWNRFVSLIDPIAKLIPFFFFLNKHSFALKKRSITNYHLCSIFDDPRNGANIAPSLRGMRLLNLAVASLGARQRWKERKEIQVEERGRERGTRKKGGAGGKRARSTSARSWRGDGHPRVAVPYQTNAWPGRDRCVARLITYLRLHYCKQCVSLCVRPLSLSLSLSLSFARHSTPFHLVCPIQGRLVLSFDTGVRVHFTE